MDYELDFIRSLAITIFVETAVLILLSRTVLKKSNLPIRIILLTGIVASMATLPYFWFVLPVFIKSRLWYTLISEILAIVIESFIISGILRLNFKKSMLISVCCNITSYLTGLIITM